MTPASQRCRQHCPSALHDPDSVGIASYELQPQRRAYFVFGNSSGAVIALDMAKTQPRTVRAVIVHEPPVPRVLPLPQARK
nr:hypothetical protein [Ktedonobacteraceae bacterium]